MADKNLKARIVNKNGTSAEWEKATSFIPKKGELILYTDLNKIKIGDGVTVVGNLPFSDDDKVSKAGDTMTGALFINFPANEGKTGGFVGFGVSTITSELIPPGITGLVDDNSTTLQVTGDVVTISGSRGDANITLDGSTTLNDNRLHGVKAGVSVSDAVNVGQLDEKVYTTGDTMTGDLKMADASGAVKGSLSDTTDGVALSAENGACLKVGAEAVTVCDNAGGNAQIKNVRAPVDDTDAANKKYVDDAIPTTQIEKLSSAVAKAEPFFVEVTMTNPSNISANKTFAEIKTASDAGKLCYARITNSGIMMPLIAFDLRVDKRVAVFSSSNLLISTFQTISLLIAEDNSVSTESFNSQSQIEATGLLKGSGNGTITAAVAGTDYAAANHTHDTYTATEIDTMWNAVTIS